jgi:hypothetical protein
MKGRVAQLRPGQQFFDIVSGRNIWTECREDGIHLSIGNDHEVLRTYKLAFDLMPRVSGQRCQYLRWKLLDSCGKTVFRIYKIGEEIGTRHELSLTHKSNVENKAKRVARRKRNWKYALDLLDPYKPVMSVVREKPTGKWLSTWMREIMTGRFGGNIYRGVKQEYEEAISWAENEYLTEMNKRRKKYRNLERVNARRHREKMMREMKVG